MVQSKLLNCTKNRIPVTWLVAQYVLLFLVVAVNSDWF